MRGRATGLILVVGLSVVAFAGDGHKCDVHKKGDKADVRCDHKKKCAADLEACKKKCDSDQKCIKKCEQYCKKHCKINKKMDTKEAAKTTDAKKAMKPQTTCPVMGGAIDKEQFVDVKGKRVYVCCAGCIDAVKKDPDKYLKKMADEGITVEDAPK